MIPIAVGTASFFFILVSDWAEWKRLPALKAAGIISAAAFLVYALVSLLISADRFHIPMGVRIGGVVCAGVFLFLLVYSHFLELPFLFSYKAEGDRAVVSEGTYALTRHPGVLFLFFLHLSLVAVCGSRFLLLALPFWTGANFLLVCVEDAVLFPRIFESSYGEYRKRVPFILPSLASIRQCYATIFPGLRRVVHHNRKHK
jgi:protein-S-isoprenylcysteine O-methyltransferase Ste14